MYIICEWSQELGRQIEREATESEAAAIEARKASATILSKAELQAQIDEIERATIMNRLARELALRTMEKEAAEWSADTESPYFGVPPATILSHVIGYVKAKAIDDQIAALRAEIVSAP